MINSIFNRVLHCVLLIALLSLTACQGSNAPAESSQQASQDSQDSQASQESVQETASAEAEQETAAANNTATSLLQLMPLQKGEELAVLHTTMGDIKLRFFPEEAPKAVENFITHAKEGYYDGVIFHRVIDEFMIQGGDPQGTGTGGESIWGGGFASEFSMNVRHFRGALSMAHSAQPDSNGSQFFIVQNKNLADTYKSYFEELRSQQDELLGEKEDGSPVYLRDIMPLAVIDEYIKNGGTPHLDMVMNEDGHTVFGHVVEGMEVVDAIAAVPVIDPNNENFKPVNDVLIESISFEIVP